MTFKIKIVHDKKMNIHGEFSLKNNHDGWNTFLCPFLLFDLHLAFTFCHSWLSTSWLPPSFC